MLLCFTGSFALGINIEMGLDEGEGLNRLLGQAKRGSVWGSMERTHLWKADVVLALVL